MPSIAVCKNRGEGGRQRKRDRKLTNVEDKNISMRGHTTHEVKLILTGCMTTCGGVFGKVLTYDDNQNRVL
jgi:hypothetical protein